MEKIRLGRTGIEVSRLGFGGIPIQRISEEEAVTVVKRCFELGITFVDTANGYTTSEERIGKAISGRRGQVIIATKSGDRTCKGIEEHLNLSLERLKVNSIDLYQFHGVSDLETLEVVLSPGGPMTVVEEARKARVVKHIGISSHSMDVAKEAVRSNRFETIMFPLNFIACEAADELLPLAREHDVGFIAMKPLAGGMLDNVTIAFKYLFQFPDIVLLPGIEGVHEIEEIVQLLEGPREMTEEEMHEMGRLRGELGDKFCRRCDYCQPCVERIAISSVMVSDSFAKRLPLERMFSGGMADVFEKAANCNKCGECEERCPYHLPIRERIVERVKWYQAEKEKQAR